MIRPCGYCDEGPGVEPVTPYQAGDSVGYFHPSCMAEMKARGSCSGDDDDDFDPRPMSPGGDA